VNTEANLCEQVSNVDLTCPIKKGKTTIVKDVELPKEIPPVRSIIPRAQISFANTINRERTLSSLMHIRHDLRARKSFAWRPPLLFHR
jgi:hypothetical protein